MLSGGQRKRRTIAGFDTVLDRFTKVLDGIDAVSPDSRILEYG